MLTARSLIPIAFAIMASACEHSDSVGAVGADAPAPCVNTASYQGQGHDAYGHTHDITVPDAARATFTDGAFYMTADPDYPGYMTMDCGGGSPCNPTAPGSYEVEWHMCWFGAFCHESSYGTGTITYDRLEPGCVAGSFQLTADPTSITAGEFTGEFEISRP